MKRILILGILLSLCCIAFTPSKLVQGIVKDAQGNLLEGITVSIKNSKSSVITDAKGIFSITVPDDTTTLVFTGAGYKNEEIKLSSLSSLNIIMRAEQAQLQEVVVTGYATKKKSLTASITVINQGLQDAVPGIVVNSSPAAAIRIRGTKSLDAPDQINGYTEEDEDWRYNNDFNTEAYDHLTDNPFLKVNNNPLSTFSIDVDAASYSNIRRFITSGQMPPPGAVRIEEMINYFSYTYPQPKTDDPFSVNMEYADCPWNTNHKLVLIGLQGKKIAVDNLPASNLVFLIDVSGSMAEPNKLPLVQASLKLLTDQLREQDKVTLIVYAGNAGLVLPATNGNRKTIIKDAIDKLEAGGSTAGGAGIQLAYKMAREHFIKEGNNRVILCTDGDFNIGISSNDALINLIEKERKSHIFLTVLGYGTGNYQDNKMQLLADKGNGNHAYIDGINEAKKVLVNEFGGTLYTIAKDVKLQVEFNPDKVKSYRLIGYENRMLAKEDFNNDQKDAGELGSNHTVTALYEIAATDAPDEPLDSVDALRYQKVKKQRLTNTYTNEVMHVKLRYKQPGSDVSKLLDVPLTGKAVNIKSTSENFRFAASVAAFGMILRESAYKGKADLTLIEQLAGTAMGPDEEGYRKEFLQLVAAAAVLKKVTVKE